MLLNEGTFTIDHSVRHLQNTIFPFKLVAPSSFKTPMTFYGLSTYTIDNADSQIITTFNFYSNLFNLLFRFFRIFDDIIIKYILLNIYQIIYLSFK